MRGSVSGVSDTGESGRGSITSTTSKEDNAAKDTEVKRNSSVKRDSAVSINKIINGEVQVGVDGDTTRKSGKSEVSKKSSQVDDASRKSGKSEASKKSSQVESKKSVGTEGSHRRSVSSVDTTVVPEVEEPPKPKVVPNATKRRWGSTGSQASE